MDCTATEKHMSTDKKYTYQNKSSWPGRISRFLFFFFFKKANKVQPYLKSEVLNKSSVDFVHGFDRRKPTFG